MRRRKGAFLCLMLLCVSLALSGCIIRSAPEEQTGTKPNLGLLEMMPYEDQEALEENPSSSEASYMRVDLWLDASQVMGGINPNEKSVYPHSSKRYREGGFHYRNGTAVGWYERVLRNLLASAEGSRVRVLRVGNERLPDSFLMGKGLAAKDASPEALRSVRRDLLTYAINPMVTLFDEMSGESMADSFYSLGTPKLNQMGKLMTGDGEELENPGLASAMSRALEEQIGAILAGEGQSRGLVAVQTREDKEAPLLYALDNLDFSRLSVITFDPAGLRRLSGTDTEGRPVAYVQRLLEERGLFDEGLCIGLYAFQLDYMGQIISFGAADFSEPLIWGKPVYNQKKQVIDYIAAMPRTLMTLVIGTEKQVGSYMSRFSQSLRSDAALQGLRGPEKGELTYSRNSMTITQQPFSFGFWETVIARPQAGYYTQHTQGASLIVQAGLGEVQTGGQPQTVMLAPEESGKQGDRTLLLRFPLEEADDAARLDLTDLENAYVEVVSALVLTETLQNSPESHKEIGPQDQVLPLRDQLYVYTHTDAPFEGKESESPFGLVSVKQSGDGKELICELSVKGSRLRDGYYRVRLCVDVTGREVQWLPVSWIDGAETLSVSISNEEIARWETYSAKMAEVEGKKNSIPKNFQHAWGSYTDKKYSGLAVPDFPPVEKALGLKALADQMREAAKAETSPYVRYVFDVLVGDDARGLTPPAP